MSMKQNVKRFPNNGHARFSSSIPMGAPRNIFKNVGKSFLWTLLLECLFTILASAALYSCTDPNRFIAPASLSLFYIFSLFGGFMSAKRHKGSPLLCGLLFSTFMQVTMLILTLLLPHELSADHSLPMAIGLRGIAVALSILGAFIGVSQKKKPNKRRR